MVATDRWHPMPQLQWGHLLIVPGQVPLSFCIRRAANGIASKIKQDPKKPLGFQVRLFGDFALDDDLKSFQGNKNFPIGIR